MFAPEFLYKLSPRDEQVTWLDPLWQRTSQGTAAVSVSSPAIVVPDGRLFLLQHVFSFALGGGAQTTTYHELILQNPDLVTDMYLDINPNTGVAGGSTLIRWDGSVWVPPRWRLFAKGTFSAGAVINTVTLTAHGVLIPIGNVQRV